MSWMCGGSAFLRAEHGHGGISTAIQHGHISHRWRSTLLHITYEQCGSEKVSINSKRQRGMWGRAAVRYSVSIQAGKSS